MTVDILTEFQLAIPNSKSAPNGWTNICCPSCNDKRYRGGFKFTPTGGFRYSCFNGGCDFNSKPTGWEPGSGFGGRPRRLFELMGGDVSNIPATELMLWHRRKYNHKGDVVSEDQELEVEYEFPTIEMPNNSQILTNMKSHSKSSAKVYDYLMERGESFAYNHPFMWSPEHPYYLLIPYKHYGGHIVGYLGRHIFMDYGAKRFIQQSPQDYIFNQHLLTVLSSKYIFVVESPMDAIALKSLAVRGSKMTQKQINLLNTSGKDIVIVPDQQKNEWKALLDTAKHEGWYVSTPMWGKTIKDVGECVKKNSLLYTIELLLDNVTKNYLSAITKLKMSGN